MNTMDKLKKILINNNDELPEIALKQINNAVDLFKQTYGFQLINNPSENYKIFIRMWRSALVIKKNGEIKSTNMMVFQQPELFWDLKNGSDERETTFDETKYDANLSTATIMNDSIPNVLVKNFHKVNLQDFNGDALYRNIPEMVRDFNTMICDYVDKEYLSNDVFEEDIDESNIRINRSFLTQSNEKISRVIKEEIDEWVKCIQNLDNYISLDNEVIDILNNARIPHIHIYNWLCAFDIKDKDKAVEIKKNRINFAKDWPMMISSVSINKNIYDKIHLSVEKGEDIAHIIAHDVNVSIEEVNKFRCVTPKMLNNNFNMGKNSFFQLLKSPFKDNSFIQSADDYERLYLTKSWVSEVSKYMALGDLDKYRVSIPNNIPNDISTKSVKRAISVLPIVIPEIAMLISYIPKAHAINGAQNSPLIPKENLNTILNNNVFNKTVNPISASLAIILSRGSMKEIVTFINKFYDNIIKNHNLFHKSLIPTYEDYRSEDSHKCCYWKSFADNKKIILPSGGYIKIITDSYNLHEIEKSFNIPLIGVGFNCFFNKPQIMALYDINNECIAVSTLSIKALDNNIKMNINEIDEYFSNTNISDKPNYITNIIMPLGKTEPNQEVLSMLWEIDSEIRSFDINIDVNKILQAQRDAVSLYNSDSQLQYIPYGLNNIQIWHDLCKIIQDNNLSDKIKCNSNENSVFELIESVKEFVEEQASNSKKNNYIYQETLIKNESTNDEKPTKSKVSYFKPSGM